MLTLDATRIAIKHAHIGTIACTGNIERAASSFIATTVAKLLLILSIPSEMTSIRLDLLIVSSLACVKSASPDQVHHYCIVTGRNYTQKT